MAHLFFFGCGALPIFLYVAPFLFLVVAPLFFVFGCGALFFFFGCGALFGGVVAPFLFLVVALFFCLKVRFTKNQSAFLVFSFELKT